MGSIWGLTTDFLVSKAHNSIPAKLLSVRFIPSLYWICARDNSLPDAGLYTLFLILWGSLQSIAPASPVIKNLLWSKSFKGDENLAMTSDWPLGTFPCIWLLGLVCPVDSSGPWLSLLLWVVVLHKAPAGKLRNLGGQIFPIKNEAKREFSTSVFTMSSVTRFSVPLSCGARISFAFIFFFFLLPNKYKSCCFSHPFLVSSPVKLA